MVLSEYATLIYKKKMGFLNYVFENIIIDKTVN